MRGMLAHKSPLMQFILLISIALVSVFFIGGMIGSFAMVAFTGIKPTDLLDPAKLDFTRPEVITYMRGMQVFQFISLFLVPSLICARLFSTDSKKYLGLKNPSNSTYYIVGAAVLVLALPLTGLLGELNKQLQLPSGIEAWAKEQEENAARTIEALVSQHTVKDLILNLVTVALLAAVGEELLFRGVAQRLLIKMFRNHWAGIIIAAILFSALHMQFYGFLPRFFLGVILGLTFWYSGSLWVAMLAHFVYDAVLIIMVYAYPEKINEDNIVSKGNIALGAAASFLLVALLVIWMRKRSRTRYEEVYAMDNVKNHPFDFEENTPV